MTTKKPNSATKLMDTLIPPSTPEGVELVGEVEKLRNDLVGLIASTSLYADVIRDPKVSASDKCDQVVSLARGIIEDTKVIKDKLDKADKKLTKLKGDAVLTNDMAILIPRSIEVHQEYQLLIEQWQMSVQPLAADLSELLYEIGDTQ